VFGFPSGISAHLAFSLRKNVSLLNRHSLRSLVGGRYSLVCVRWAKTAFPAALQLLPPKTTLSGPVLKNLPDQQLEISEATLLGGASVLFCSAQSMKPIFGLGYVLLLCPVVHVDCPGRTVC